MVGYATQKRVHNHGCSGIGERGPNWKNHQRSNLSNSLAGRLPGVTAIQVSGETRQGRFSHPDTRYKYDGKYFRTRRPRRRAGYRRRTGKDQRCRYRKHVGPEKMHRPPFTVPGPPTGSSSSPPNMEGNGPPQISYTFNHGWAQPDRIPKMANAVEYAEMNNLTNIFDHVPSAEWGRRAKRA